MSDFTALANHLEDLPGLRACFLADRDRQRLPLRFDNVSVELREERDRLIDERGDRQGGRVRRRAGRLRVAGGSEKDREDRGSDDDNCARHVGPL